MHGSSPGTAARRAGMKIFSIREVPLVGWSSRDPSCLRPRPTTICWLVFGLFLFGLGEVLLIAAGIGVTPWTVLAQGIGRQFDIGIGAATLLIGVVVLLLWIPLRRRPGIGTFSNVIIVAATIEFLLPYVPVPQAYPLKLLEVITGIFLIGLGSGAYLVANLGAGPRDGLMTGIQSITGAPIAFVRLSIELIAVFCGWLLGGVVGLGTVLFAVGVGPAVSLGLYLTARFAAPAGNSDAST